MPIQPKNLLPRLTTPFGNFSFRDFPHLFRQFSCLVDSLKFSHLLSHPSPLMWSTSKWAGTSTFINAKITLWFAMRCLLPANWRSNCNLACLPCLVGFLLPTKVPAYLLFQRRNSFILEKWWMGRFFHLNSPVLGQYSKHSCKNSLGGSCLRLKDGGGSLSAAIAFIWF